MTHAYDVLTNQLAANADDPSWYLSFKDATDNLTEEEAFWKPDGASHSIAELTQHLIYWNETWQTRYEKSHVEAVPPVGDNNRSFLVPSGTAFAELREKLLSSLSRWQTLLTKEQVDKPVNGFPVEAEWWALIGNAATHNAYHIGQIVYIRKLQKYQKSL